MALAHLTDEQTRTWSRGQKDRWWFENVYRGDLPQLTVRSGITGFFLGGILSATNLYIAGKTGVTLGVNLTSVILAFAMFRLLSRVGLGKDFTILENNAMQSIATAAGYMTVPLTSSLAAYMMVTNVILPRWHIVIWMTIMSLVGVLVAFPLKRRFINEDQLPFPEGRACGVVLDALYHGAGGEGIFKAKVLSLTAGLTAVYQFLVSEGLQRAFQFNLLRFDRVLGWKEPWHFHERIDHYYYLLAAKYQLLVPKILGTDFRTLGLRLGLDAAMFGVGGLMGIRVATSVMLGTAVNFFVLAPWMIARGDIATRIGPNGETVALSRIEIVNQWSLWWGVTMMVVGSLVALAGKPEIFTSVFKNLRGKRKSRMAGDDVLRHIEVPLWISY
ncbi:MAG TPA: OPT/YSL family transporter, partial [Chthoniobacterales bacterium]|nr:OPT/YSL family transporter [Chthoniobacterales bacterium]